MPELEKVVVETLEPGHYFGCWVSLSHVGTQDFTFRGKDGSKIPPSQKTVAVFELHKRKRPMLMKDWRPFVGSYEWSTNISPKSKMGKAYIATLGKDWQSAFPGNTIHTNCLLGGLFKVQVSLEENKKTREVYTKFSDPQPLDPDEDADVRIAPKTDLLEFEYDKHDPDDEQFKSIPQWIRNKAKASHELRGNYRDPWDDVQDEEGVDEPTISQEQPSLARGSRRDYE